MKALIAFLLLSSFQNSWALQKVSSLVQVPYDQFEWNTSLGRSQKLELDVPKGAISFSIYAYSESLEDYYLIDSVVSPQGQVFVSDQAPPGMTEGFGVGPAHSDNQSLSSDMPGFVSLLVPNNPKLSITPGKWTFTVRGLHSDSTASKSAPRVLVLVKTKSNGPINSKTTGALNINMQFTGSDGLTAATSLKDSQFQIFLKTLKSIYKNIGVELNIKPPVDTAFSQGAVLWGTDAAIALYKSGIAIDAVNMIFVGKIFVTQQLDAQGLSGALLGPIGIPNAPQNGVLISTQPISPLERKAPTAYVAAHEIGHYLGLPHTFELNSNVKDPFSDTEESEPTENLMQPGLDHAGGLISPQQKNLIFLSPAVTLFE